MSPVLNDRKTGRVMAIDYGEKRIGIALSDPMRIIASPFLTIENNGDAVKRIGELVQEHEVTELIAGLPKKLDGAPGDISEKLKRFIFHVENKVGMKVTMIDERFTSVIAANRVLEAVNGKKKRRDKSLIDKHAAAVLLEGYLRSL